jgi:hypothetical protein
MAIQNFGRVEQYTRIVTLFATRIEKGIVAPMSAYAIAKSLRMKPSTHLYKILAEMCYHKKLERFSAPKNGRYDRHVYMLPEGTYTPPTKGRKVNLNAKGKLAGQLDMWP